MQARAQPVPEIVPSETTSTASLIDVDSPHVSSVPSNFDEQEVKTKTQADRLEREAESMGRKAAAKGKSLKERATGRAKTGGKRIRDNADNPVVLGNAVLTVALFGGLGYGAYVKYRAGEFTWKLVGIGAAVLGAFGLADYYASQ